MRTVINKIYPVATIDQIRDASRYKARKITGKFRTNVEIDAPVVTDIIVNNDGVFLSVCNDDVYRAIWSVEETAHGRVFVPVGENVPNVEDYVLQGGELTCACCNVRRKRKYWYVIEDMSTGRQFTVGTSCAEELVLSPSDTILDYLKRQGLIESEINYMEDGGTGEMVPIRRFEFLPAITRAIGAAGVILLRQRAFNSLSPYDAYRTVWHTVRVLFREGRCSAKALNVAIRAYTDLVLGKKGGFIQNPIHIGYVGKTVKVHIEDVSYYTQHTCWVKDEHGSIYTCRVYDTRLLRKGDIITGIIERHTTYNGVKQNRLGHVRRVMV